MPALKYPIISLHFQKDFVIAGCLNISRYFIWPALIWILPAFLVRFNPSFPFYRTITNQFPTISPRTGELNSGYHSGR